MKTIIQITLIVVATLMISCKSTQHVPLSKVEVSKEDFIKVDASDYTDAKAVIISQNVDVRIQSITSAPWKYKGKSNSQVWTTTVEDKILVGVDNINNEQFTTIEYYYPKNMRWDLMTNCEMWIYSLADDKSIKTRKLNKDEMIRERVNDTISCLKLNIREDMTGKILFRRYALISPYYVSTYYEAVTPISGFAKLQPWYFQRKIPLKAGRYQILLPLDSRDPKIYTELVQLGEGVIDVKSSFVKETMIVEMSQVEFGPTVGMREIRTYRYKLVPIEYNAQKIVATVSDVEALPENKDPLGVEIVHRE